MSRILVTGMSGAGKSTMLTELARRGHFTVDTDHDGWELPGSVWDEPRMSALLAAHADVVVSGTVENQGRFYSLFEHVILLSAPVEVLIDRIANRRNNPYGRTAEQQADVRRYVRGVEPLLRRGATVELDGRRPVAELADVVESLGSFAPTSHGVAVGRIVPLDAPEPTPPIARSAKRVGGWRDLLPPSRDEGRPMSEILDDLREDRV